MGYFENRSLSGVDLKFSLNENEFTPSPYEESPKRLAIVPFPDLYDPNNQSLLDGMSEFLFSNIFKSGLPSSTFINQDRLKSPLHLREYFLGTSDYETFYMFLIQGYFQDWASIGYATLWNPPGTEEGWYTVLIMSQYWGMGIGSLVANKLTDIARVSLLKKGWAKIRVLNKASISMFQKVGFVDTGIRSTREDGVPGQLDFDQLYGIFNITY